MRKRIFLFVAVLSFLSLFMVPPFLSSSIADPDTPVLTFNDFYQKVLRYYPQLKQQAAHIDLAIARKLQAASGFLPSFQLGTAVSHGDEPVYVFGALLRENRFTADDMVAGRLNTPGAHTSYNASLTGQVPIFDAMQTISQVRSAKLQMDSAQDEKEFAQMEAFLIAAEAYLRTVAIENMLATVNEVSRDSEADIKQAEDLKEKGLILGADFYTAKVALGNINQMKNQLGQEKKVAYILLNILMGEDLSQPWTVSNNAQEALLDIEKERKTLQSWIETAFKSRPDWAAIDKIIQAQEIEVGREKASVLPRIDAFGEARNDVAHFSYDGGRNFLVGVKAKIDLFDPSYFSRVRMSQATLKKLEADKAILQDSISRDLANEFARYQTAQDNLPVIQKMLEDAKQAVDLTLPLYREGRKSIADLLAIRSAYLNTARGFYSLKTDTKTSWTRMLFLSGQLGEADIPEVIKKIGE